MKVGSLLCIEVRSLNDTELINLSKYDEYDKSYTTDHKRWLYNINMILEYLDNNLEILELEESYNFSKVNQAENPLLIRFIARKNI